MDGHPSSGELVLSVLSQPEAPIHESTVIRAAVRSCEIGEFLMIPYGSLDKADGTANTKQWFMAPDYHVLFNRNLFNQVARLKGMRVLHYWGHVTAG